MSGATSRQFAAFPASQKRIPRNPKYAATRKKVDTGASASQYRERMEYIQANFKYKKGEIFKRIKVTTLAQLIIEVAEAINEVDDTELAELDEAATYSSAYHHNRAGGHIPATAGQGGEAGGGSIATAATGMTSRSTLLDVIRGVGAMDDEEALAHRERVEAAAKMPKFIEPYLVVDLRDPEDYERCHIRGAINFPASMLSRAQNHWSPEMYGYINKHDRMIVVYDLDEKIATRAAETFVQRGVDNVFLLSGGLRVLCEKIPDGIVVGELPGSERVKARSMSSGTAYTPLTRANIEQIREQLDTIRAETPSSIASSRAGSRAPRGRTATRTAQSRRAPSEASSKAWR
eukprot:m.162332 g.162332  ORF g.162332 m.162332 type:complete len:347 (+) comp12177_c0_seq1:49-1089(+)